LHSSAFEKKHTANAMACRSRALVCFVREATRSPTWRARSIRGVVTSASALYAHHPTAVVDPRARLAPDTSLGAFCVVSAGAVVGPGCRLGAGVHLLGDVELGARCTILSHAVIGAEVRPLPTRRTKTARFHERRHSRHPFRRANDDFTHASPLVARREGHAGLGVFERDLF
jgi:UDP-3-O-[3-hydroxymyristoyl] glucosamine N-acyltransferase